VALLLDVLEDLLQLHPGNLLDPFLTKPLDPPPRTAPPQVGLLIARLAPAERNRGPASRRYCLYAISARSPSLRDVWYEVSWTIGRHSSRSSLRLPQLRMDVWTCYLQPMAMEPTLSPTRQTQSFKCQTTRTKTLELALGRGTMLPVRCLQVGVPQSTASSGCRGQTCLHVRTRLPQLGMATAVSETVLRNFRLPLLQGLLQLLGPPLVKQSRNRRVVLQKLVLPPMALRRLQKTQPQEVAAGEGIHHVLVMGQRLKVQLVLVVFKKEEAQQRLVLTKAANVEQPLVVTNVAEVELPLAVTRKEYVEQPVVEAKGMEVEQPLLVSQVVEGQLPLVVTCQVKAQALQSVTQRDNKLLLACSSSAPTRSYFQHRIHECE